MAGFDKHRLRGQCMNPADRGLIPVTDRWYECWGFPGDTDKRWADEEA